MLACPCCKSIKLQLLEVISRNALCKIYRETVLIDVAHLVVSDINYLQCEDCDLRFFDPQFAADEAFYTKIQNRDWYYLKEKSEFRFACRHIERGDHVLEIGAGEGNFAKHIPFADYLGLEYSGSAIELAEKKGIRIKKQSIEDYSNHNAATADVVCTFQVLEHVTDIHSFLTSAKRCLKPGGKLLISVPSEDSFMALEINNVLNLPPHHQSRWTDTALTNIAVNFGFELVEINHEPLSDDHLSAFAGAIARTGVSALLVRPSNRIDPLFRTIIGRAIAMPFSSIVRKALLRSTWRPSGHTVFVALRLNAQPDPQ